MSEQPCVLVVSDPERAFELVGALSEPLPTAVVTKIEVVPATGGDDTVELFETRKPQVVVVTATLEAGDTAALVGTLRGMVPRGEVAIVVVGDAGGPIRTALDAIDLAPDRFVSRPLSARALRFAVASGLEAVLLARGSPMAPAARGSAPGAETPSNSAHTAIPKPVDDGPTHSTLRALRARWAALADSISNGPDEPEEPPAPEPAALTPPPVVIKPRRATEPMLDVVDVGPRMPWRPGTTAEIPVEPNAWSEVTPEPPEAPVREPTLIIRDVASTRAPTEDLPPPPAMPRTRTPQPPPSRTRTGDDHVDMIEREQPGQQWSEPMRLTALIEHQVEPAGRDSNPTIERRPRRHRVDDTGDVETRTDPRDVIDDLPEASSIAVPGRDFARQLRAKMSMMAQRLFQGADAPAPAPADLAPRHDHHTEIDLASLAEEPALGAGVTEIESQRGLGSMPELATSPGSWDTQVRERGLPDAGELVRGVSDAAMLLAKMFAGGSTGRIAFKRDSVEKVVFLDQGRPVFASSSEPRDRMGELLVREGKITAAQYERCQTVVADSGRRTGEILVDFGYLKRRELLPAVRRHVEDIVYSLFSWDRGSYKIVLDERPSEERIRLSRHPAALVLEGIRRKLDRTTIEKLLGPPSTVIEVADRERLGGIINMGDLAAEERGALAAFDGQADLAQVARTANVDVADVLPLAWGLCVLGLATARRTDTEIPDESTALVGETDLAIDRERVRARWQLVTEADYFALLGVRRDATTFEIRRAYQSARRDFAADGFPNDLRRELAQELDDIAKVLDEAFRVLRDDRLRMTYLTNLVE